jgi:8-oxo-dGTP diphosphatase
MTKRLYPDQPIVGVGVVILKGDKILLGKRLNEPAKGKWSIPGGAVELGETIEQAVIREAKEETCLDVSDPILFDVINELDFDKQDKVRYQFVIVDYIVTVSDIGEPKAGSDAVELRWASLNEVEDFDLTRSFRFFFTRNRQKLEKISSVQ